MLNTHTHTPSVNRLHVKARAWSEPGATAASGRGHSLAAADRTRSGCACRTSCPALQPCDYTRALAGGRDPGLRWAHRGEGSAGHRECLTRDPWAPAGAAVPARQAAPCTSAPGPSLEPGLNCPVLPDSPGSSGRTLCRARAVDTACVPPTRGVGTVSPTRCSCKGLRLLSPPTPSCWHLWREGRLPGCPLRAGSPA